MVKGRILVNYERGSIISHSSQSGSSWSEGQASELELEGEGQERSLSWRGVPG